SGADVAKRAVQTSRTADERSVALTEVARHHFHLGEYREAARAYRNALDNSTATSARCARLLDLCDVYRVMGAPVRSVRAWWRARTLLEAGEQGVRAVLELKKTLLLRDCYNIARKCGLMPVARLCRALAKRSIEKGSNEAWQSGHWHELQQF